MKGPVAINTFGWERREVAILPEDKESGQGFPATKKPRLDQTQTLHDQSQIGTYM